MLATRPVVVRRAAAWGLPVSFQSLDELLAATGFHAERAARVAEASSSPHETADDLLARLVVIARTDELAARVLLQRLLPGLAGVSRRWSERRPGGSPEAFDELVATAWQVVRTFSLHSRRRQIAARMLRAVEHLTFVKPTRRLGRFDSVEPGRLDVPVEQPGAPEPLHELLELLEQARPALGERDLVMVRLLIGGRSMAEVAHAMSVSVRTVTNHRNALVHRVRSAVAA